MATPVIQYGFRDDDDESVGGGRRSKLFQTPRQLKKLGNPKKQLGRVLTETRTLLKGAKGYGGSFGNIYGLHSDDEEESSESSYESESDSDDDASVCSKASVASKASKTLKKLGSSFRGAVTVSSKRRDSTDKMEGSLSLEGALFNLRAEDDHHNDDDSDDDLSVASSASRASKAVKKVTSKLSKALKVSGHRRNSKHDDYDSDEEDDYSSEEEDLLDSKPRLKLPGLARSKSFGEDKVERVRPTKQLPRRCNTSEGIPPRPRYNRRNSITRHSLRRQENDQDEDGNVSDLSGSDHEQDDEERAAMIEDLQNSNWSMNVTPEMLEQMNQHSSTKQGGHNLNPHKNLLAMGELKKNPAGRGIRAA